MSDDFYGQRIAIAGMGVSGLAVARAAKTLGARPTVLDESPGDVPRVFKAVDQLAAMGVEAVTSWHGHLDPTAWDAFVVSPGFRRDHPSIKDMRGKPVMSEVEFASRIALSPILAITGTNGKSTTTVMLHALLESVGERAILCGNIAGSGYPEMPLVEAAMLGMPGQFLVAEISSYQLEFVSTFRPKVAAITNVTPDHSDRHPSFEDYFDTKMRLFQHMGKGDTIIANADEPSVPVMRLRSALQNGADIVTFSPVTGRIEHGVTRRRGDEIHFGPYKVLRSEMKVYGDHNIANAMMAWEMAARVTELDGQAVMAIQAFPGLANRMEVIGEKRGVRVINNSMCTNPAAVIASSSSITGPQHILMGGNLKNLDFSAVGAYLSGKKHQVYLYGPEPALLNKMLGGDWPETPTLESAFLLAVKNAVNGDTILLSPGCASTAPFTNFIERGDAFRLIAREWLSR